MTKISPRTTTLQDGKTSTDKVGSEKNSNAIIKVQSVPKSGSRPQSVEGFHSASRSSNSPAKKKRTNFTRGQSAGVSGRKPKGMESAALLKTTGQQQGGILSHELTLRESGPPNWLVENRAHLYSSATSDENFSQQATSLRNQRMQP